MQRPHVSANISQMLERSVIESATVGVKQDSAAPVSQMSSGSSLLFCRDCMQRGRMHQH